MHSILPPRLNKYPARPILIDGDVARIPLTRGMEAIIDAEDLSRVEGYNWNAIVDQNGHIAAVTSFKRPGVPGTFYLHRVILGVSHGDPALVDHKDGNTLDNRKSNLRTATNSQNTANRHAPTISNSGFKGVWFDGKRQRYVASIGVMGVRKIIGRFEKADEAARAYDAAAIAAFGQFARTNSDLGRYNHGQ